MQVHSIFRAVNKTIVLTLIASSCWLVAGGTANAQATKVSPPAQADTVAEKTREIDVDLGGQPVTFDVPVRWKAKKPMVNFIKHDLRIEKVAGDPKEARMTFSLASGAAKANVDRWKGQFKFATGDAAAETVKVKAEKIGNYEVTIVEINGSYLETMGGPFAGGKKTLRPDYVMLAAIIGIEDASPTNQKCFVKLVGPKATVQKDAKVFREMVKKAKYGEKASSFDNGTDASSKE
jgi:gluconolactonase